MWECIDLINLLLAKIGLIFKKKPVCGKVLSHPYLSEQLLLLTFFLNVFLKLY